MFMFLKIVVNKNFEYNSYFKNKLTRAYLVLTLPVGWFTYPYTEAEQAKGAEFKS